MNMLVHVYKTRESILEAFIVHACKIPLERILIRIDLTAAFKNVYFLFSFLSFFLLAMPCSTWDLNAPTRG